MFGTTWLGSRSCIRTSSTTAGVSTEVIVLRIDGRVILIESVLQPANTLDLSKLIDLEMMLMPGGRERTEAEFRSLFEKAGFTLQCVILTPSPLTVIEAAIRPR